MRKKDRKREPHPIEAAPVPAWKVAAAWGAVAWILFVVLKFDRKFSSSLDPALQMFQEFLMVSPLAFLKASVFYLKSTALLAVIVVGAAGVGARLSPRSLLEKLPPLGQFILSTVFGYMVLSMSVAALGFLGFLSAPALYALLAVFAFAGVALSTEKLKEWKGHFQAWKFSSVLDSPASWLLIALCGVAFVMAFVPELFYDSLVYHLGLPQMYINEGRILDTPNVYFSRAPMLIHMLYVLSVGIDGSSLAKLINWSLLMAGIGGIFVLCRLMGWAKHAVWGALFIAAMPVVQLNVWSTAIDAAMGVFLVLSVSVLILWAQNPGESVRWFWAAGALAGAAFASKYTGVVAAIVLGVSSIALMWRRAPLRFIVQAALGFGVFILLIVGPWLVRNRIWTGNPFYPILSTVFESRHMNVEKMEKEKHTTQHGRLHSIGQYLEYPWKQSMLELTSFNFIGPMTLAALPLLLFLGSLRRFDVMFLLFVTGFYFVFSLQFAGDIRYLIAGFFLLSVLLAGGLSVAGELKPLAGFFVKSGILIAALYHTGWILQCMEGLYRPASVLTGSETRGSYSATMHDGLNLWPWNAMDAELRKLPESSRIYILGNEQVFGFPRRFWYSSVHDNSPFVSWANESANASEFLEKLKKEKFTHVLIDAPEAIRLKGYEMFQWTPAGRRVFIDFANRHLHLVTTKQVANFENSLFLFEIHDALDKPEPFGNFGDYFKDVLNLKEP